MKDSTPFNQQTEVLNGEAQIAWHLAERSSRAWLNRASSDLAEPMTQIQDLTDELLKGPLTDRQRQRLRDISAAAGQLNRMLGDLVFLPELPEAGVEDLNCERFDVPALLAEVRDFAIACTAQLPVDVIWTRTPDCPRYWNSDIQCLKQVLFCLVSAAAARSQGGTLHLASSRQCLICGNECLQVSVQQRSREERRERHNYFGQPEEWTASAELLVKNIGGRLECESNLPGEHTATVHLPLYATSMPTRLNLSIA